MTFEIISDEVGISAAWLLSRNTPGHDLFLIRNDVCGSATRNNAPRIVLAPSMG